MNRMGEILVSQVFIRVLNLSPYARLRCIPILGHILQDALIEGILQG